MNNVKTLMFDKFTTKIIIYGSFFFTDILFTFTDYKQYTNQYSNDTSSLK